MVSQEAAGEKSPARKICPGRIPHLKTPAISALWTRLMARRRGGLYGRPDRAAITASLVVPVGAVRAADSRPYDGKRQRVRL